MTRRALLALALLAGCDARRSDPAPAPPPPPPPASASAAPSASPPARPPLDTDEAFLAYAPIVVLSPVSPAGAAPGPPPRPGTFGAVLDAGPGPRRAQMEIALAADPLALQRPLAVARLAAALGMRVVPPASLRRVSVGELSAHLLYAHPEVRPILAQARVQNDGTVDALLSLGLDPPLLPIDPNAGPEVAACARWARSPAPAPGEDREQLRDYVEMIALDYLAADVARQRAYLAGPRSAIVVPENGGAFPPRVDGPSLDRLLRRLAAVERFPRGLRGALQGFDRARAEAVLAAGGFEERLLSPRALVALDERRASLITLIEAKVGLRGEEAVLSL